jgi:hypothetical protein
LGETGGDLNLALMLVQRTLQSVPQNAASGHPAVAELQAAIDGCSGFASAVQDLAASVAAFEKGDIAQAVATAQAAHRPLWQASRHQASPLLPAVDRWIQFLRGDSESESERYQKSQRAPTIAIQVAPPPDLRQFLLAEGAFTADQLDNIGGQESLINQGQIGGTSIKSLLERHFGMPAFSWSLHPWDPALVESFGLEASQRRGLVPISRQSGRVLVGMLDPADLTGLAEIRRHYAPAEVQPVILRRADFDTILQFCRDVPG